MFAVLHFTAVQEVLVPLFTHAHKIGEAEAVLTENKLPLEGQAPEGALLPDPHVGILGLVLKRE
jgi:hypothetical protein